MFEKSLQKLEKALSDLENGQQKHFSYLQYVVALQQMQIDSIERAVIGEPSSCYSEITSYIDKHGF